MNRSATLLACLARQPVSANRRHASSANAAQALTTTTGTRRPFAARWQTYTGRMHDSWGRAAFIVTYLIILVAAGGAWLPALPLAAIGMTVTAGLAATAAWRQQRRLRRALRHHTGPEINSAKRQALSGLITAFHGGSTIVSHHPNLAEPESLRRQGNQLQGYGVDWRWAVWLTIPIILLTAGHALPLGINQATSMAFSTAAWPALGTWSLAPEASWWRLLFLIQLPAFALSGSWLFRHQHVRDLVSWLVIIAAIHAGLALVLQVLAPDLPNPQAYVGRVRGSFVYPNQAATFWAAHLPLALAQARLKPRRWHLVAPALLAIAIVLSASRSAIGITLVVSGFFCGAVCRRGADGT